MQKVKCHWIPWYLQNFNVECEKSAKLRKKQKSKLSELESNICSKPAKLKQTKMRSQWTNQKIFLKIVKIQQNQNFLKCYCWAVIESIIVDQKVVGEV